MVHGIDGMMIIPLLGIALLVVSFFAKFDGAVKWWHVLASTSSRSPRDSSATVRRTSG